QDVAGATAPALSVPVTADSPAQRYRAVFTNAGGSATTDEARIALAVAPAVATHPISQTVALGDSVSFTATAHGVPDPPVQWERSIDAGVTWTAIAGAAGATYTFTPAAGDDGRRYRARFTNDAGTTTSNVATLTITAQPQVVLQPEDISIDNNTGGSLGAFATGLPAPQQRWQISTDGGATFTDVTGATGPALAVSGSRTLDGARYRAVFTNTSGTVTTRAATLNVRWVQVTRQLACPRVRPGQRVTLTAEAAGNPAPNVSWSASVPGQGGSVEIVGATSTTYSFTATAADANRAFSATFTNPAASSPAVGAGQDFTYCSLPVVLPRAPYGLGGGGGDLNWESVLRPGGPATVSRSVSASGNPAPDAVWQVSDDGGLTWAPIPLRLAVGVATTSSEDSFGSGSTSTTLTWTPTHAEDGLRYRVLFANTAGASASAPTTLVSSPVAPEITRLTPGDASMTVEWNAPFSGGKPITKYTVVALPKTGGASIVSQDFAATATSATLAGLANGLAYDFLVKATTAVGTSPDSARKAAIVGTAPGVARIRMTPSKPSIAPGGSVTFTVTTLDALGNPIADVTAASTLRITALIDSHGVFHPGTTGSCNGNVCTAQNFDLYSVSATYGSLNASADLTVEHPPTLLGGDSGVKSWSGLSTVTLHETAVGDSAPTAAWQVSTDGGATWSAVTTGGTSSSAGATTDSNLTLSPVPSDNGNRYRAVFTTGGGIVTAPVVTLATVPGKPAVTGIQADGSVTVSWAAPDSGGTPIVRYRVSGGPGVAVEAAGSATSATLVGLPVGAPTRITVVAENAAGAGPASDAVGGSARATTGVGILDVAPALATIVAGGSRAFTAADGTADATGDALFSITPLDRGSANGAFCTASSCTASVPGTYVITATHAG
ncbi:MAG: large repetitive protein, partial [Verrucomicrobiota bacterium]